MNPARRCDIAERRDSERQKQSGHEAFAVVRYGDVVMPCWVFDRSATGLGLGFWSPAHLPKGAIVTVEGLTSSLKTNAFVCEISWSREDLDRGGYRAGGMIID